MTPFIVADRNGNLMHRGRAASLKAFVASLVREGKSLSRADLRGLNLSHLDLEGADLSGAMLDGADLRGTVLRKARLRGASLRGVKAEGLMAARADLTDVDLSPDPKSGQPSSLKGSTLTYAHLDRATADRADFSGSHMTSSTMVGVKAKRAVFTSSVMHNVDWADAELISCDFSRCIMRPTWRIGARHLPDRTVGATVVGNRMSKAELGADGAAFQRDAAVGAAARAATWATITAGVVVAGSFLPLDGLELLSPEFGKGAGFVALATAAVLLKEKVEDIFKDKVSDWMDGVNLAVRRALVEAGKHGKGVASLAAAFMSSEHADHVSACLRAGGGPLARIKAAASGRIEVIVCDRDRLADALARLTDAIGGRYRQDSDIVLVRSGEPTKTCPKAVVLRRDGSVEAVWPKGYGAAARKTWPGTGGSPSAERATVLGSFMRAVLVDLDVVEMDLDPETHSVRKGKDGSVVVVRRSDGRLHNPYGPVILTPDDESITLSGRGNGPGAPRAP